MKLLFVTQNENKLNEIQAMLDKSHVLISLKDINFTDDIPEPYETLEKNAFHKASFIYERYEMNCFADDTGLEVEVLGGKPGVYSARYAGESKSDKENIKKLLKELAGVSNRSAQFRTIISLITEGNARVFEGVVKGRIIEEERGSGGFGYDPVFIPDGFDKTFAEMTMAEKNELSHRSLAIKKLCNYLNSL